VRPAGDGIDLIVIHAISLPPGEYGTGDVERLFTNTLDHEAHPYFNTLRGVAVSAHFFIARDGAITQFAALSARAWHAGVSCWQGRANCNDHSVGIELEGQDTDTFTPAQYTSLTALCKAVAQVCPIAHVAGHEHIAPERKTDPGPGFDWQAWRTQLGWTGVTFPSA
jgi:AmpD protein